MFLSWNHQNLKCSIIPKKHIQTPPELTTATFIFFRKRKTATFIKGKNFNLKIKNKNQTSHVVSIEELLSTYMAPIVDSTISAKVFGASINPYE